MKRFCQLFFLSLFFILLDAISKYFCVLYVPKMQWFNIFYPYGGIGIFKIAKFSVSLNYVANKGVAWGFFASYSRILLVIRILIVIAIILYLIFHKIDFKKTFAIILILSGAVGNVLDFFFYGHVVDMVHFRIYSYSYPLFNLADCFIIIGIILLYFTSFKRKKCK